MEEITARAILAKVVIVIMQSLPNKLTDKKILQRQITGFIDLFPEMPEYSNIRLRANRHRPEPNPWKYLAHY